MYVRTADHFLTWQGHTDVLRSLVVVVGVGYLMRLAGTRVDGAINSHTDADSNGDDNTDDEQREGNLDVQPLPLVEAAPYIPDWATSSHELRFSLPLDICLPALCNVLLRRPHPALLCGV